MKENKNPINNGIIKGTFGVTQISVIPNFSKSFQSSSTSKWFGTYDIFLFPSTIFSRGHTNLFFALLMFILYPIKQYGNLKFLFEILNNNKQIGKIKNKTTEFENIIHEKGITELIKGNTEIVGSIGTSIDKAIIAFASAPPKINLSWNNK